MNLVSEAYPRLHASVLAQELLNLLQIRPGGHYIDGTVGAGGHLALILESLGEVGKVTAFDWDQDAIAHSKKRFARELASGKLVLVHGSLGYDELPSIENADGILLDLGLSSDQIEDKDRGFSFESGPLDMRFDRTREITAADILNDKSESDLADIFYFYADEKRARVLARYIVNARKNLPATNNRDFCQWIKAALNVPERYENRTFARMFQAVRIAVNDEFKIIERMIQNAFDLLNPGGVLAVISFHSGEDRIIKHWFKRFTEDKMDPNSPYSIVIEAKTAEKLTKKPILPTEQEITANRRARSAKLRAVRKLTK